MATIKSFVMWSVIFGSIGYVAIVAGYLQEFHLDDVPDRAAAVGVRLPLADPRIEVSLQRSTLSLFDGDVLVKRYGIGHGRESAGRYVNRIGSTPLGEFQIVERRIRDDVLVRGSRFLVFDFPSPEFIAWSYEVGGIDDEEYRRLSEPRGPLDLPTTDTALGGPIGIQGNYFFYNETRFTDGCIAMGNGDINELFEYVPVGTPVIIAN